MLELTFWALSIERFFINFSGYVNLLQDILSIINVFVISISAKHFKLELFFIFLLNSKSPFFKHYSIAVYPNNSVR